MGPTAASGVIKPTYPARQLRSCPDVVPMRASQTIAIRCFLALLAGLSCVVWFGNRPSRAADEVRQSIAVQFSLDRPIDAGPTPFVLASGRGLFTAQGLAGPARTANGAREALAAAASP